MSVRAPLSRGAHLFAVSNLGQVRNVATVVEQLELETVSVLVLWTADGEGLRDRIEGFARDAGLTTFALQLPRSPVDRFPARIRRIVAQYRQVGSRFAVDNLWLANTNRHYGALARVFAERGARIHYYEEGLGSYRSADDRAYVPLPMVERLGELVDQCAAVCTNQSLTLYRRVRGVGYRLAVALADGRLGRWLNTALVGSIANDFYQHRTSFDVAAAAFPTALDRRLIHAQEYVALDLGGHEAESVAIARAELETSPSLGCTALFVSQTYGATQQAWSDAIASALAELPVDSIAMKFHPRESAERRSQLVAAVRSLGIEAVVDPALDRWPAETVIEATGVRDVIGLTSSVLIYGSARVRCTRYRSVAADVMARLSADQRVEPSELRRFVDDVRLFERVEAAVRTSR